MEVKYTEHGCLCACVKKEDFRNLMIRKTAVFAALLLLLSALLSGAAGAEGASVATPTDLDCTHGNTRTEIRFYDSPGYTFINAGKHLVYGAADVVKVCLDCGEVLSKESVSYIEETRSHLMRKGRCVYCGYQEESRPVEEIPSNVPGERTVVAGEDGSVEGLLALTLTNRDLYELEKENVSVLLVRSKDGSAAIALNVAGVLKQTERTGADLRLDFAERKDGSFYAGIYLVSESGEKMVPDDAGITVRFYRSSKAGVRANVAPANRDDLVGIESVWNEQGYWSVPYLEEGTYFLLQ